MTDIKEISNNYQCQISNVKYLIRNWKLEIRNWKFKKGFSLIELLIVIAIIAMLITAGTVSWQKAQAKSRDSKRKTDLKTVQEALERFYTVNGKYPASNSETGRIQCGAAQVKWGLSFYCNGQFYMAKSPQDPIGKGDFVYFYYSDSTTNNDTYILGANLENANDPDRLDCPSAECQVGDESRNYIVTNP